MTDPVSTLRLQDAWRECERNKFAHDYPDDGERNAALINVASEVATDMFNILAGIEKKLKIDQPVLVLGKPLSVVLRNNFLVINENDYP